MTKTSKKEIQNFIKSWSTGAHEVADKVTFWNTILRFLGVPQEQIDNRTFIDYEKSIKLKENEHFDGSIDAYIPSTHVLIEQKSTGVDLNKKERRPNGGNDELITPYQQARRYDNHLSANEHAYFYVLCNFDEFIIYDIRESVDTKPIKIELKDLDKKLDLLGFLVNQHEARLQQEQQISVAAGDLVSKIYNELSNIFANYDQLDDEKVKHSINSLCVRLVFCLYAEDAGLFDTKEAFYNYLKDVAPNECGLKLKALFKVLNTKIEDRTKHDAFWNAEHPDLKDFPYVNGGLFADESIFIPPFTQELKDIVLNEASKAFDWSAISPTIFGAVFESTLNPETRRSGGMHYTSVENIHKVIDPLFLNDLKQELEDIKKYKNQATIKAKALVFQDKLAKLTFFDPACGSGNFLTETFLSLRRLENEAIRLETGGESLLDVGQSSDWIKVSIKQFYGIEINDFAVSVAKTAMWIAEDQMQKETQDLLYAPSWDFLPLKTYVNIHEGDALKMDWNTVLGNYACHYIIGNPPFAGYKFQSKEQKEGLKQVAKGFESAGTLDFVCAWFIKASNYIFNTKIKVAFVATNSIIQGESVYALWLPLFRKGIKINFAYRTFIWSNEAQNTASVFCVIIGFSYIASSNNYLWLENGKCEIVKHINGYLLPNDDVFIKKARKPISLNVPKATKGNAAMDGGFLVLTKSEKEKVLHKYPELKPIIKTYLNSHDFINGQKHYCFWFTNDTAIKFRKNPEVVNRLKAVQQYRLNSKRKATYQKANQPMFFTEIRQPKDTYIFIPVVSSDRRKYIPIGFLNPNIINSYASISVPNATLYDFGILNSSAHNAWVKLIAGRLGMDYRYATSLVYNTFPWPTPTDEQRKKIVETAQAILDARAKYPDSSLADLYDPLTMPAELLKAHKANDKAVLQAYGLPTDTSESDIVAHLFKMYENLTN